MLSFPWFDSRAQHSIGPPGSAAAFDAENPTPHLLHRWLTEQFRDVFDPKNPFLLRHRDPVPDAPRPDAQPPLGGGSLGAIQDGHPREAF